MRSTLVTLFFVLLSAAPASAARVWFSTSGVAENEPITGTPGEFINYNTGLNPALDASNGTGRLYVWASIGPTEPGPRYHGLTLDLQLHVYEGEVHFSDHHFYNYESTFTNFLYRWSQIIPGAQQNHLIDDVMLLANANAWGLTEIDAIIHQDIHFDPLTKSMLLGYVNFETTPGARADLFLGLGRGGFGRQPPTDEPIVYFGWDDEPLRTNDFGARSRLPDAKIVPEPASALLLVGGALLGLRRR